MSDKYWFDEPQSMTGYGNIKLGTKTVNSRDAVDVMNKQAAQIKLLREALDWAEDYTPFSGNADMNAATKALSVTAKG